MMKELVLFWNLSVIAKDPWRLALGGPRILARRTFLRYRNMRMVRFWNLSVMAKDRRPKNTRLTHIFCFNNTYQVLITHLLTTASC